MHKALNVFNLESLFKSIQDKNSEIKNITQDLDSEDSVKVVICRTAGDAGSFSEPHNVSISRNVLKPETVKVFCDEWILNHDENRDVEVFKEPGNVFHLALIVDKEESKPEPKLKNKKEVKTDAGKGAKDLTEALVSGKPMVGSSVED